MAVLTPETRYITDLDPLCALAIAATASPRQAEFLRDFIYKYLACRALIGVEIPVGLALSTPQLAPGPGLTQFLVHWISNICDGISPSILRLATDAAHSTRSKCWKACGRKIYSAL